MSATPQAANYRFLIDGIGISHFTEKDVVRHNLVQQIIRAYEEYDGTQPQRSGNANNIVNGKSEPRATEPGKSQIKEIN